MRILRVLCSFVMVIMIMVCNAAMADELTIEHSCGLENLVYGYSYIRLSGEEYTDNGDGTHSYMGIRSAQAYCSECDIVYLEPVAEPEAVTVKCSYFQDCVSVVEEKMYRVNMDK